MAEKNYLDTVGYWLDPDRGIHREGFPDPDGEQTVILEATPFCTDAEWELFREALMEVCARRSINFSEWPLRRVN